MPVDRVAIERELRARQQELNERLAQMTKAPERGSGVQFGKRVGDGTTEAVARLTDVGVGPSLEVSVERIARALEKLEDGTYGCCDICGKPIARARLEARPESVLCIDHARASH